MGIHRTMHNGVRREGLTRVALFRRYWRKVKKRTVKSAAKLVFLLSPANLSGRRAGYLLSPRSRSELAARLSGDGVELAEIFSFISGLYFRGKWTYVKAFAGSAEEECAYVITAAQGLMSPFAIVRDKDLRAMAGVEIHHDSAEYTRPLERDARALAAKLAGEDRVVLLRSIATPKYIAPLSRIFGRRLMIPAAFVGLGDMARGAMMLRAARENTPLEYVAVTREMTKFVVEAAGVYEADYAEDDAPDVDAT